MSTDMTPEMRVRQVVGGNFTPDALGRAYDEISDAIRADPDSHLAAFERLYLNAATDAPNFADLHLPHFLRLVGPLRPRETLAAGQRLSQRLASYQAMKAGEAAETVEAEATGEIARQRRRLAARSAGLQSVLQALRT